MSQKKGTARAKTVGRRKSQSTGLFLTQALIIELTLFTVKKFGKLARPTTYLAVGINLFVCLTERSEGQGASKRYWKS